MSKEPKPYDYYLQLSIDEGWDNPPDRCPHCQNGAVAYSNQDERGNDLHGYIDASCDMCGKSWSLPYDEYEDDDE